MSETILSDLQTDLASRLEADEYFSDIPVITERKADIASRINRALSTVMPKASKIGICVVMLSPIASCKMPNLPGAIMNVEIAARVLENVVVNSGTTGTGKPALAVARRIARVLHHYRPDGLAQILSVDSPTIVPVEDPVAPLAYEVRFVTQESDTEDTDKVATPVLSVTGGAVPQTVTLSCSTSSAEIWYTLDGTYPAPGRTGANLYASALTLNSACNLRAAAFKPGCIASDTALGQYT